MTSRRLIGATLALPVICLLIGGCGKSGASVAAIPNLDGPTMTATSDAFETVIAAVDKLEPTLAYTVKVTGATGLGGDGSGSGHLDFGTSEASTSFTFSSTGNGTSSVIYLGNNMYFRPEHAKNKAKPWLSFAASDPNANPVSQVSAPLVMDPIFLINEIKNALSTASPTSTSSVYDVAIDIPHAQANATGASAVLEQQAARSQAELGHARLIRMRVTLNTKGVLMSIAIDQTGVGAGRALFTFSSIAAAAMPTQPPASQVVDVGTPSAASEGETVPGADGDAS